MGNSEAWKIWNDYLWCVHESPRIVACVAGGIVLVCAVEFMCAWIYVGGRAKTREESSWFLATSPPFPTRANKQKPPATQATNIVKLRIFAMVLSMRAVSKEWRMGLAERTFFSRRAEGRARFEGFAREKPCLQRFASNERRFRENRMFSSRLLTQMIYLTHELIKYT